MSKAANVTYLDCCTYKKYQTESAIEVNTLVTATSNRSTRLSTYVCFRYCVTEGEPLV